MSGTMPVMGLELGPECIVATGEDGRFALDLTGLDAGESLALFLTHCGGYELRNAQSVLNIGPRGSFEQSYLNVRAKTLALKGVPLCDALVEVQRVLNPAFTPPRESGSVRMRQQRERSGRPPVPAGNELLKPVTVDLHGAKVRDILNALVASHRSAAWMIEQRNGGLSLPFQTRSASLTGPFGPAR